MAGTADQAALILLLLVLPIAGFGLTALVGRRLGTRAWIIAVPVIIVTWLVAMVVVYQPDAAASARTASTSRSTSGSRPGAFRVPFSLAVDNLTAVMLIVVTTVGMLVHVYSIGYMAHDAGPLALLRLPQPLHVQHAAARPGRPTSCCSSRPGSWWACRATCSSASGTPGASARSLAKEGLPRQPRRRRRLRARHHGHLDDGRAPPLRRGLHAPAGSSSTAARSRPG